MIDVKRLVMLRDLADHGKVSAVADLHGVTPSAISQQLRALEAEAGATLVLREGRGVRLTAAGAALAAQCENVLAALERAEGAIRALDTDLTGELGLGCPPSALSAVATPLLAELAVRHPRLRPRLVQCEPEEAVRRLKQHDLDLAVGYHYHLLGSAQWNGITAMPLFDEPLVVVVPTDLGSAVADGGLTALRAQPWLAASPPSTCREVLLHTCRNAAFTPRIDHTCDDLRAALSLVAAGLAVTIVPKLLADNPPPGTAVLPLPGPGRTVEALVRMGTEAQPAIATALAVLTAVTSVPA